MSSAYWVDHFREFFRDVTAEKIAAMDEDAREDYAAACWAAFHSFGDPRSWEGFDDLTEIAKYTLNGSYENWPGPEETQRQIDLAQLGEIPVDTELVMPTGARNSAAWVAHFDRYFKDMTNEKAALMGTDGGLNFIIACANAFENCGDPTLWIGFDGLSDMAKHFLTLDYKNWAAPAGTPLIFPKDTLLS